MTLKRLFSSSAASQAYKNLTVIGSGQMGVGIAYVAAMKGEMNVKLVDSSSSSIAKAEKFVAQLLERSISKGKIDNDAATAIVSRLSYTQDLNRAVAETDVVVEAVPESVELKQKIFSRLATVASKTAILGTNTSSISISKVAAAAVGSEHRVVGIHFMNPVPVQSGVEVIRGVQTNDETHAGAIQFAGQLGKVVSSSQDTPGFLANRLLVPYINEAVIALETGVGSAEDIDSIMVNGCAMPMGPLKLADFIGLDTCLAIMQVLYKETGDSKYRPSILLSRLVDAKHYGKKSGKGFYTYT